MSLVRFVFKDATLCVIDHCFERYLLRRLRCRRIKVFGAYTPPSRTGVEREGLPFLAAQNPVPPCTDGAFLFIGRTVFPAGELDARVPADRAEDEVRLPESPHLAETQCRVISEHILFYHARQNSLFLWRSMISRHVLFCICHPGSSGILLKKDSRQAGMTWMWFYVHIC